MQELLYYMYSGRSPNLQHMALDLLAAADRFQLPGLKEMADQVGLAIEIYQFAGFAFGFDGRYGLP